MPAGPELTEAHVVIAQPDRELRDECGRALCRDSILTRSSLADRAGGKPDRRGQFADREARVGREGELAPRAGLGELSRSPSGHETTVIDDRQAIAEPLSLFHRVGCQHDRHPRGLQPPNELPGRRPSVRIHARSRLVEEHHFRTAHQREGQGQALTLAGRHAPHQDLPGGDEPDPLEQLLRIVGLVIERGKESQRFQAADARGEATLLEHHAHSRSQRPGIGDRIQPQHADRSLIGPAVSLENLHRRGLAGPVRSEQAEHLAGHDVERQTVDRSILAVTLFERRDLDCRYRHGHRGHATGDPRRDVVRR